MPVALRDNQLQEVKDDEIDYELISPTRLVGTHANMIPMLNNAQAARSFYGSRFVNQVMPLTNREAPLVQALDPEDEAGNSFEQHYGKRLGAAFSDDDGTVEKVTNDSITLRLQDGTKKDIDLYNNFQFNRKTQLSNKALVKKGDVVKPGQILAGSNYTDDTGTSALGINARVAVVPYEGYSMDDAIVISESFAKRLTSEHSYEHTLPTDGDLKRGRDHFQSLFPTKFTKDQLANLDDNGNVLPGTILKKGDPIMLATKPKTFSSNSTHLGKLSKLLSAQRSDASEVWDHDYDGYVTDVAEGKKTSKVFILANAPSQVGDKIIAGRNGQKDIISKIIPDEQILRGADGTPFEVLLNPLSFPSRVNAATSMELALGKLAKHQGKPIKVPGFNDPKKGRIYDVIEQLKKAGLSDEEEAYDPMLNEKLQKPISAGIGYIYKLHHVVDSKLSSRGNSSYNSDEQPLKGGSDGAQAKRLGGLETTALMSKGGYANLREGITLRGAKNDSYWRLLRQGYNPPEPGAPFVWDKFKVLLNGAGYNAKDLGKGVLRLAPFTDRDLESHKPIEVKNGKLIDPTTMEPIAGGLFDPNMLAHNSWGKVTLNKKLPNPAFEGNIQTLLGIKQADLRKILSGEMTLDEAQGKKKKNNE